MDQLAEVAEKIQRQDQIACEYQATREATSTDTSYQRHWKLFQKWVASQQGPDLSEMINQKNVIGYFQHIGDLIYAQEQDKNESITSTVASTLQVFCNEVEMLIDINRRRRGEVELERFVERHESLPTSTVRKEQEDRILDEARKQGDSEFLLSWLAGIQTLLRGDDQRRICLPDLRFEREDSPRPPMVALITNGGKANKSGRKLMVEGVRHKNCRRCFVSALANNLLERFSIQLLPLCLSERKFWYSLRLLPSLSTPENMRKSYNLFYNSVDINWRKCTLLRTLGI